jgi:CheY-like chemotaxis protein
MNKIDTLCVIDDDDIYTSTIKKIKIADVTKNTIFFDNGKVALDYFNERKHDAALLPKLILLDLNMPVLDGWQFLAETDHGLYCKLINR